jgi:hypothetical protein
VPKNWFGMFEAAKKIVLTMPMVASRRIPVFFDAAPPIEGDGHHLIRVGRVGDIAAHCQRLTARGDDGGSAALRDVGDDVGAHHARAGLRQPMSEHPTDVGARSGDNRGSTRKALHGRHFS